MPSAVSSSSSGMDRGGGVGFGGAGNGGDGAAAMPRAMPHPAPLSVPRQTALQATSLGSHPEEVLVRIAAFDTNNRLFVERARLRDKYKVKIKMGSDTKMNEPATVIFRAQEGAYSDMRGCIAEAMPFLREMGAEG